MTLLVRKDGRTVVQPDIEMCGAKNPYLRLFNATFPRCERRSGHAENHRWHGHEWRGNDEDGYLPA